MKKHVIGSLIGAALTLPTAITTVSAAELNIAVPTIIRGFDVQNETGNDGAPMFYQVFDTLIERDPYSSPLTYQPGLATSWEQIEPTVWKVNLREGVKMHDGTVMNADDVAFSLNRVFHFEDPEFFSTRGRFFYNFTDVEVIDEHTVHIHTERPEPLFEMLLSARNAGITSKQHYDEHGFEVAAVNPVGTGPYIVTGYTPRENIVMERFDDHWGEEAPFDKLTFQRVSEVASRVAGLANGEFDLITNIPPDQESSLNLKGVETMGVTWPMFHVWVINMNAPGTDNPLVRRAMRLCTDREALNQGLWGGKGKAPNAHQFAEYGEPLYMSDLEIIKYDPELAKELLKQADYQGEPVEAQFQSSYYLYGDLAAQVIQQQWAECGIKLDLKVVERYDYKNLNFRAWSNPMYYPDPMGAMDTHWSTESWVTTRELWDPQNEDWFKYYELARYSTDIDERQAAYKKLLEIGEEESGWLAMYQPYELYAMKEGLEFDIPPGLRPYTLPLRAGQVKFNSK